MVFNSVTNRFTSSGDAQQDELIEANADMIADLQGDVDGLQAALDCGPVETSGPTVHLAPEDCDDLGQRIIDEPNARFVLESNGEYPIRTEPRLTDPDQPHRELAIEGNGALIVVADESVGSVGWFGRKRGGAFSTLSLQNLTLVVDPEQGYDAGWGRFWIDDRVQNANLSIEGRRDYNGSDAPGDKFAYFCCMTTPSGLGVHRHIDLGDGDTPAGGSQFDHAIGVGVEPDHEGTNLWVGCYLENWWDNGYYVKDGTGRNILLGCEVRNCGGANIRLGTSDVAIACRSVWDLGTKESHDYAPADCKNGTCLDADAADATAVVGMRVIKKSGENDAVRLRTLAESATYQNLYVENYTSQWALRVTAGSEGGTTNPETGILEIQNGHIFDMGTTTVRGGAVRIDRDNVVLTNTSINASEAGGSRSALWVSGGQVRVDGGRLEGAGRYAVVLEDGVDRVDLDGVTLQDGVYLYEGTDVGSLTIRGCDMREAVDFPAAAPDGVITEFDAIANDGGPSTSPRRASGSGWGAPREISWLEVEGQEVAVYDLEGDASGLTVAIVGGVHGDEDAGYRVAGRFANAVPQQGTLRVIPRAFPSAIAKRARGDGYDLNRQYDRSDGPQTDLAQALWEAVRDADAVIDLHRSTDIYPDGNGQAVFSSEPGRREGQQACVQFNARYVDPNRYGQAYKFSFVPNQSSGSGIDSLIRYCATEGMDAHLIETTTCEIGMETAVEWLESITHELLWQYDVVVE